MSDGRTLEINPTSVTRRGFLKTTGVGVAGGTLAAMLDARQAPAQSKGTTLRILQWSHFIPAYDNWFDSVGAFGVKRVRPDLALSSPRAPVTTSS